MIAAVTAKGTGEIAPGFSERLTSAGARERDPAYAEKVRTMIRETSREGFAGCAEAIKASAVRPRIKDIRLPTLFVVGDQDAAVSIDLMKEMQAEVPGAKLAVIENAGHLSNMEQPAAFNKEIRQFIDSIH
jgi:3-oxoadipate enol-lactonase